MGVNELLLAENKALCEGKRLGIYEAINRRTDKAIESRIPSDWKWKEISQPAIARLIAEAKAGTAKKWSAYVGEVDRKNGNSRIYPRQVWQDQTDRFTPQVLESGTLSGAVDHLGFLEGGNLKNTCIIWESLSIQDSGMVAAHFVVIADHSQGADFLAQLESGLDVGFSTYGYGTGHEPGEMERTQYQLGEDEYAVIMDRNFELKKIDSVDDPSVAKARIRREATKPPENTAKESQSPSPRLKGQTENDRKESGDEKPMKTLAELQTQFPEVFALHESAKNDAVKTAVAAATATAVEAAQARLKPLIEGVNALIKACKPVEGVELPQRDVLPAETATQIANLETQLAQAKTTSETAVNAANTAKTAAETKLATIEAEKADLKRKSDAAAKLDSILAGEQYENVSKAIRKAAEKRMGDKAFTAETVEAFVAEKAEEYGELQIAEAGLSGVSADPDEDEDEDDEPIAKSEGAGDLTKLIESANSKSGIKKK